MPSTKTGIIIQFKSYYFTRYVKQPTATFMEVDGEKLLHPGDIRTSTLGFAGKMLHWYNVARACASGPREETVVCRSSIPFSPQI